MLEAALPPTPGAPPPGPPVMTMEDALIEYRVNVDCNVVYNGATAAQRISTEVFDNHRVSFIDG